MGGRCRSCGERISSKFPAVELLSALLVFAVILDMGFTIEGLIGVVFVFVLVAATMIDLEFRIIPNKLTLAAAITGIILVSFLGLQPLLAHLLAAVIAGVCLFIPAVIFPAGMGMGDVKLVAVMGLFLGRAVAPAIFIAMLLGAVVGLWIIVRKGAEARKMGIPFGPCLAIGGVAALFVGNQLLDLYLSH
jgi:leader peptidase (prepilin peptidase)/N-methyltransferase